MTNLKKYRYKLWLEVERVEINGRGEEIGKNERGETFGFEPEKIDNFDDFISGLHATRQDILDQFKAK